MTNILMVQFRSYLLADTRITIVIQPCVCVFHPKRCKKSSWAQPFFSISWEGLHKRAQGVGLPALESFGRYENKGFCSNDGSREHFAGALHVSSPKP